MSNEKMHLRHSMLYEFNQGKNATQATKAICSVYGNDTVSILTCQYWFERFRQGDFSLEDKERTGRPPELVMDELEALLEEDPHQSTREWATKLNVDKSTVLRHLHAMGKINKMGKWI